ncbi:DNA polymerase III subunit alpha [Serinibacter arcticus]|uniref:DNA polymerase III subunit alpha n=1 Tax=Serinibacter arcticus TaxID=1655435 RepID=UPI0010930B73|nr:DNA polymerase III subunit alpha [Serinibacter arcticus]
MTSATAPLRTTTTARRGHVPYAELHTHSAFSFLDGANQPEELVAEAVRLGLEGLAITDHDGLHGVVRFSQAARAVGLPTVIGAELGLNATTATTGVPDPQSTHLLVLARDPEGYARLSRAIATAHLVTGRKGQRDYGRAVGLDPLEVLAEQSGGPGASHWLVLTGCRKGPLRRVLDPDGSGRRWDVPAARRELDRLVALFGRDNVAVELTDHARPTDGERNAVLVDLAHGAGVTAVVTGGVHAARPRDAPLADVLAAVRARSSLEDIDGWLPPHPAHLRSGAEMLARHAAHPQAVAAAARLSAECAFDLTLVAPNLPPYPVPEGHTEATWLRELTLRGAREKYGTREAPRHPDAWATIDKELDLITRLDFPGYFLIVGEIVDFCRREGILCQGRGSAANSAVCYSLGITAVDAVQHKLLFERFLSDGRTGPPDIDLDIESGRREEAIQFVYDRYGREFAAQVANVISYRARSAVRDSARAFGYDVGQQDAWSKGIERWGNLRGRGPAQPWWHGDPAVTGRPVPEAAAVPAPREKGVDSHDPLPPINGPATAQDLAEIPDHVLDMADQMLRLPRHLGIHSGGMVMCDRPVIEVCPVEWATMPGRTVLQWDKDDCADAGLVKFDLLGLGMLTALRLAFEHVAEVEGTQLALHSLPQEDPAVFELLQKADTVGVFQVESRAQIATLPRLKPVTFYDIVIEVALIRPGPIQGNSVHPFIRRKNGREPVVYLHEKLRPALEKTLGVPLFQEQLMQIAIDVAAFTAAEADQLRRAMGSKRSQARMEALRGRLLEGMERNGIGPDVALQIYDKLRAFADFGFPESHAFSFAYLVYASTWLKAHHPEAFYAGLLGAQPMGFYSPSSLVADARRHGMLVRRACVATSRVHAHVERTDGVVPTTPSPDSEPADGSSPVDGPPSGVRGLRPRPTFARETWLEDRTRLEGTDPGTATWDTEDDDATASAEAPARRAYAMRLGLAPVRGIGERTAERIVAARTERAFTDAADLARRARLTPAQVEALATAGALQVFGGSRRQALWAAGALAGEAGKAHTTSGGTWVQEVLVGTTVGTQAPALPEMGAVEIAVADVWASGVSPEHHPTHFVRPRLRSQGVRPVSSLVAVEDGVRVEVGGVVTHRQRPGTAQGVTFLALEDETGMLNVVCSAGLWARHRRTAVRSRALVVRGTVERTDGVVNLLADGMRPLSLAVATSSRDFQ